MTPADFSGLPFDLALGEVYGLRMWKMDRYGRLRARNWDKADPWRPGVNIAQCLADTASVGGLIDPSGRGRKALDVTVEHGYASGGFIGRGKPTAPSQTGRYLVRWDDGSKETLPEHGLRFGPNTHAVPDEGCHCGFYAYTESRHAETKTPPPSNGTGWQFSLTTGGLSVQAPPETVGAMVLGVIRGTGRTLIGTKGFRCEKAEIVALRDPTRGGAKTAEWRTRQRELLSKVYPDVPVLPSRAALLEFAPIEPNLPDPSSDEFWSLP